VEAEQDVLCTLLFDIDIKLPFGWLFAFLKALQGMLVFNLKQHLMGDNPLSILLLGGLELAQLAWKICNDSFRTLLCVEIDPDIFFNSFFILIIFSPEKLFLFFNLVTQPIAVGSIYLAASILDIKLPENFENPWHTVFAGQNLNCKSQVLGSPQHNVLLTRLQIFVLHYWNHLTTNWIIQTGQKIAPNQRELNLELNDACT
jgi:hypothetical protein